ncbi:F-box/kelch-repeat protein [Prunus yedoensis var. nudiflora]|uniref:F-box/kelch-repeat protein n=1 Tax=Prunus yedoensis var. nudiflora TaxID=2094558 RepID=A0A315AWT9_PRUYE|nr:F-box/kelch-repeat protein [Prunus yedoensis var. nudiflora]
MADYFPEEVIHEILLRLPIKSLIKFRAVCKSWWSLIKSSTFINTHLSRRTAQSSNQNDGHLLLLNALPEKVDAACQLGELFSLHWDNPEFDEYTKLVNPFIYHNTAYFPKKITFLLENFHVVATFNGLICLAADFATIIWNPSVRKFMFLPRPRIPFPTDYIRKFMIASYAFGYDSRTDDYKVLRIVSDLLSEAPCEVEVWSLARGYWKTLSAAVIPADFNPAGITLRYRQVFVNGVTHWQQSLKNEGNCIVQFDMVNEVFGKITVPDALKRKNCFMSRYGESLALFETYDEVSEGLNAITCIHMWVMKEFGVPESWTKLMSICLEGTLIAPFGFRRSCELVFRMYGGMLLSVDSKTKQVKEFKTDGYRYHFMDSFVESLVLLGQPNAISY